MTEPISNPFAIGDAVMVVECTEHSFHWSDGVYPGRCGRIVQGEQRSPITHPLETGCWSLAHLVEFENAERHWIASALLQRIPPAGREETVAWSRCIWQPQKVIA